MHKKSLKIPKYWYLYEEDRLFIQEKKNKQIFGE